MDQRQRRASSSPFDHLTKDSQSLSRTEPLLVGNGDRH
jgi:hypothetical protein